MFDSRVKSFLGLENMSKFSRPEELSFAYVKSVFVVIFGLEIVLSPVLLFLGSGGIAGSPEVRLRGLASCPSIGQSVVPGGSVRVLPRSGYIIWPFCNPPVRWSSPVSCVPSSLCYFKKQWQMRCKAK